MKRLRLEITDTALSDILEQADWYTTRSTEDLAVRWEEAVSATMLFVLDHPSSAPLCGFQRPALADVRRTTIRDFPRHLIFYRVHRSTLIILRVVHGARDLESLFSPAAEP